MWFLRWLPTFLSFPLGGLLASRVVGEVNDPVSGLLAGLLAGVVIGTAQWLALRSSGLGYEWAIYTAVAMGAGSSLAAAVTDAGATDRDLVITGFVVGAAVGAGQAVVLARGARIAAAWVVVVSVAWALGWLATANVIVDADRGYVSFGASGALIATVVTGVALHRILGADPGGVPSATPDQRPDTGRAAANR